MAAMGIRAGLAGAIVLAVMATGYEILTAPPSDTAPDARAPRDTTLANAPDTLRRASPTVPRAAIDLRPPADPAIAQSPQALQEPHRE
jgi:hypothetical protein